MPARRPTAVRRPVFRSGALLAAAAPTALALLAVACASGRVTQPVPADAVSRAWPAYLGSDDRAASAVEAVPARVGIAWETSVGRGLTSPLIVDGPLLVAATTDHRLVALETGTGGRYWFRRLTGPFNGGLVLRDGRVFAATDELEATAVAVDVVRGGPIWRARVGAAPMPPALAGDTVLVATEAGVVHALAAEGGREHWSAELPGRAASPPVAHRAGILVATTADSLFRLDLADGRITGRAALPGRVSAPPSLRGDVLYVPVHGPMLVALDVAAMEEAWRAPLPAATHAAPVAAPDGLVYVLTEDGGLWRVAPDGPAPEPLLEPGGAARASLAVAADGLLVGRLDGTLILVRPDGEVGWSVRLDGPIAAPATVDRGAVYVPLLNGTVVKLAEAAAARPVPPRPGALLRLGKWGGAVATAATAAGALDAHARAERRHRAANRLCGGTAATCDARAADPDVTRLRREARAADDRARTWLLGAHAALAATVLLFVLDIRGDAVPPNIIFDPDRLHVSRAPGGRVDVGLRFGAPR